MDDTCKRIREQIPELIGEGLSPEKAVELEQHRNQCPACNEYFQALEADDRLLCEFAESMQPNVARLENITIDELRRRKLAGAIGTVSIGKRILSSKAAQIAAVIVIIATILIVFKLGVFPEKSAEIAGQSDESATATAQSSTRREKDSRAIVEAESRELSRMIAASDIAGAMAILDDGQPQSKIAAANYLAAAGDERAIGILAQLAAEWRGEAASNPFAAAIAQIMTRLQEQQQQDDAGDDEKESVAKETTTADGEQDIGFKGVVADEQGRPIADATVLLYHNRSRSGLGNRVIEEMTSAADGAFACRQRIEFNPIERLSHDQDADGMVARHSEYVLIASHRDYAFGWLNIRKDSEQDTYRIVLIQPASRPRGVVVTDQNGNPLAGVRIWLHRAGDRTSPKAAFRDELILPTDVGLLGDVTDASGRAVIRNLPDTSCLFRAALKDYADAVFAPAQRITRISLSRAASISGWVLAEEDEPVAGATISLQPDWLDEPLLAVTDGEGYFHLEGLPVKGWELRSDSDSAGGSCTITIKHERCVAEPTEVTLLPGQSIDDLLIRSYSDTTLVECRVVEFGTDVPVAGAQIRGWNRIGKFSGYSDSEGIFAVRVLPGAVSLSFHSPPAGVYVLDEQEPADSSLEFDATGKKMTVTLTTPPIAGFLRGVSGIVIGPDGIAQSDGQTFVYAGVGKIKTSFGSITERPVKVNSDGRFELKGVPAGRRLHLYVATKNHTFAAADLFEIPDDPDWSDYLVINLEPTQSASVIVNDENGNVFPGAEFRIDPIVDGERIKDVDIEGHTDENGLLDVDGILPGLEYCLTSVEPEMSGEASKPPIEAISEMLRLTTVLVPLEPQ
jgi:hypothetical protein